MSWISTYRLARKGSACQVVSARRDRKATVGIIAVSANTGDSWESSSSFLILILGLICLFGVLKGFLSRTLLLGELSEGGVLPLL